MEREILFRGKRRDHCGWCQGAYIDVFGPEIVGILGWLRVDPATVGQYTGTVDRTGASVYEGDVLRWKERDSRYCVTQPHEMSGIVRFGEYKQPFGPADEIHLGFYIEWVKGDPANSRKDLLFWLTTDSLKDGAVVIGNIHDNPELVAVDDGSGTEARHRERTETLRLRDVPHAVCG